MKDLPTSRLVACALAGAGCLALALQPLATGAVPTNAAPVQEPEVAAQDEEHDALHECMETLQGGMRELRRALEDPAQKEAAVGLLHEMQTATLTAFQTPPAPIEPLEGADLVDHSADFRRRMLMVCGSLIDMEVALQKEDGDAAKEIYRTLGGYKKDGHDKFLAD